MTASVLSGGLRLATLNVGTLSGRLPEILASASRLRLTLLCLQETRTHVDSWDACRRAFKAHGWATHFAPTRGVGAGGLLIASLLPTSALPLPPSPVLAGRALAVQVALPGLRPIRLATFHGHPSDPYNASRAASELLTVLGSSGDPWILAGDHNLLATQWPYSAACASGRASCWDDLHVLQPHTGTRRNAAGRYTSRTIDFALGHPSLHCLARHQEVGPGDHDWVVYTVDAPSPSPTWRWARAPALLPPSPSDADRWNAAWLQAHAPFHAALGSGDLTAAWILLSNAAEAALSSSSGSSRSSTPSLHLRDPVGSTKPPSCQPLLERKLRRIARRALALRHASGSEASALLQNLRSAVADLPPAFSTLSTTDWLHPDSAPMVHNLADEIAVELSRRRLHSWQAAVQDDFSRLAAWVKASPPSSPPGPARFPADLAAEWASVWSQRWERGATDLPRVSTFCEALPTLPFGPLEVSVDLLRAAVHKVGGTAAGLDQWAASAWERLPDPFLHALLALWHACLRLGRLPAQWTHVRIALIPKPDASMRPIAVAVAAYRACMSATAKALRSWVLAWSPPELYGGIPARSPAQLHDALFGDLAEAAQHHRRRLCGTKADIRRCFDSLDYDVTFHIFSHLGAPPGLVAVLRQFYATHLRWFSVRGVVHPHPIRPQRGLLQGCPLSPLLCNATMAVWCRYIRLLHPTVRLGIYLDDRTLWTVGESSPHTLVEAARAGVDIDNALGIEHHPDKLACFAQSPTLRRALAPFHSLLGPATHRPVLLGVTYVFSGHRRSAPAERLTAIITHRCRKIARAARALSMRRRLCSSLVLSLFRWSGPWHFYTKQTLSRWASHIESAILGRRPVPGRSHLFWSTLGRPSLHPGFALHFEALRRGSHGPCPRLEAALGFLRWSSTPQGWLTPFGVLRPAWDGLRALTRFAELPWLRVLWAADPKTPGPLLPGQYPCLTAHQQLSSTRDPHQLRVLLAAAPDPRTLQRLDPSTRLTCECGHPVATRTHVTFDCPLQPWPSPLRSEAERRLLLPVLTGDPADLDLVQADPNLVTYLRSSSCQAPVCLALDGGCLAPNSPILCSRTAWAVASLDGRQRFAGLLSGADQSPFSAERHALWHAVMAASAAQVDVILLIDNQAVTRRLCRVLRGDLTGDSTSFWHEVLARWRPGSRYTWVPSHGKHPAWHPPAGFPSPADYRVANAAADAAATSILASRTASVRRMQAALRDACAWALHAHIRQRDATVPFFRRCLELWTPQFAEA